VRSPARSNQALRGPAGKLRPSSRRVDPESTAWRTLSWGPHPDLEDGLAAMHRLQLQRLQAPQTIEQGVGVGGDLGRPGALFASDAPAEQRILDLGRL